MRRHIDLSVSPYHADGIPLVLLGGILLVIAFVLPRRFNLESSSDILGKGPVTVGAVGVGAILWGLLTMRVIPRGSEGLVFVIGVSLIVLAGLLDSARAMLAEDSGGAPKPVMKRRRERRRRPRRR